jgi:hypothetical protein
VPPVYSVYCVHPKPCVLTAEWTVNWTVKQPENPGSRKLSLLSTLLSIPWHSQHNTRAGSVEGNPALGDSGCPTAPQVGFEPTTLRLTAEFQGEAVRSGTQVVENRTAIAVKLFTVSHGFKEKFVQKFVQSIRPVQSCTTTPASKRSTLASSRQRRHRRRAPIRRYTRAD